MFYRYIAYNTERKLLRGTVEGENEGLAEGALENAGYRIIDLAPVRQRSIIRTLGLQIDSVSAHEVVVFSKQIATLLESGISLLVALGLVGSLFRNRPLGKVVASIAADLSAGKSFSEAVRKHPRTFSPVYCRMIEVGEGMGNLGVVLRQCADYIERERAIAKKALRASVYPGLILCIAGGVVIFMMTVVLPPLLELFKAFNATLPLPTRLLIGSVAFLGAYKFYFLLASAAVVAFGLLYFRRPAGRRKLATFMLRAPLIGPINLRQHIVRLCRIMSMLLKAGLPMTEIAHLVVQASSNEAFKDALRSVQQGLIRGEGLSGPLSQNSSFPPLMVQLVRVGEESGALEANLDTLAEFYEQDVEERINTLFAVIEPALTIMVALLVGFIAITVIMPIYSLAGSMN